MNQNATDNEISPNLLKMLKEDSRTFKQTHCFEERFLEYQVVRCNYPGFLPICCQL